MLDELVDRLMMVLVCIILVLVIGGFIVGAFAILAHETPPVAVVNTTQDLQQEGPDHKHEMYVHIIFEKAWHDVDIENVSETFTDDGEPYWRITLPLRNQEGDWLF